MVFLRTPPVVVVIVILDRVLGRNIGRYCRDDVCHGLIDLIASAIFVEQSEHHVNGEPVVFVLLYFVVPVRPYRFAEQRNEHVRKRLVERVYVCDSEPQAEKGEGRPDLLLIKLFPDFRQRESFEAALPRCVNLDTVTEPHGLSIRVLKLIISIFTYKVHNAAHQSDRLFRIFVCQRFLDREALRCGHIEFGDSCRVIQPISVLFGISVGRITL